MPARPTPLYVRRAAAMAAGSALLLTTGIALAPAASAVDDTARPDYVVTQGPSCHPGGVQIRVTGGTAPYRVVLATTRQPGGEDAADLAPGVTVLLHTGDVAWGETIDSRLEFIALDGSGDVFADELVPYSFTRPTQEDCAAIAPPAAAGSPATVPGTGPGAAGPPGGGTAPADVPAGSAPLPGGAQAGSVGIPGGPDLQVQAAAAEVPVAPVARGPRWAPIAAGLSLLAAAGGLALAAAHRRRRSTPTAGA